jgi:hypothetical protein
MAARVRLETIIPPVFGKEMDMGCQMANISNTGIGHFISEFGIWIPDLIPQSAIPIPQQGDYASRPF